MFILYYFSYFSVCVVDLNMQVKDVQYFNG